MNLFCSATQKVAAKKGATRVLYRAFVQALCSAPAGSADTRQPNLTAHPTGNRNNRFVLSAVPGWWIILSPHAIFLLPHVYAGGVLRFLTCFK